MTFHHQSYFPSTTWMSLNIFQGTLWLMPKVCFDFICSHHTVRFDLCIGIDLFDRCNTIGVQRYFVSYVLFILTLSNNKNGNKFCRLHCIHLVIAELLQLSKNSSITLRKLAHADIFFQLQKLKFSMEKF